MGEGEYHGGAINGCQVSLSTCGKGEFDKKNGRNGV